MSADTQTHTSFPYEKLMWRWMALLEFGFRLEHQVNTASGGLSICGPTALRRLYADLLGGGLLTVLCGC